MYHQMYSKEQFCRVGLNSLKNSRYSKEAACSLNNSCCTSQSLTMLGLPGAMGRQWGHPAGTTAVFIYPRLQPGIPPQMPVYRERTHYPLPVALIKGSSPLFIKILQNLIHKKLYEDKAFIVFNVINGNKRSCLQAEFMDNLWCTKHLV